MEHNIIKTIVEDLIPVNNDVICLHLRLLQLRKRLLSLQTSVYEQNQQLNSPSSSKCDSAYTYQDFQGYFKVLRELNK